MPQEEVSLTSSQCGFIDFVVAPKFDAIEFLYPKRAVSSDVGGGYWQWRRLLASNRKWWKEVGMSYTQLVDSLARDSVSDFKSDKQKWQRRGSDDSWVDPSDIFHDSAKQAPSDSETMR